MTAQTPIYGIKYLVQGEPMRATRAALEDNANTIEAALRSGGVATPGAQDLLTVSGRVSQLEAATTPSPAAGSTEVAYAANFAGYVDAAAGWSGLRYWKRQGVVTLAGAIRTTAATAVNAVIATLPMGFRPPATVQVPFSSANTYATVSATGEVRLTVATASGFVAALCTATFGAS